MFYFHTKTQTSVFKLLRFEERFEKHRRFLDGLVWTVGLNVEIKLRFRDGLVWTVGLTVEMKLCFQISPAYIVYFLVRQQTSGVLDMTQSTVLKGRYPG